MTRNEFDANEALMRRADAARSAGCSEEPDPHRRFRGILHGVVLGVAAYLFVGFILFAWGAWGAQ